MNPRAAINDLHPFQGCPFSHLGTSPNAFVITKYISAEFQNHFSKRRGWDSNPRALADKRFSRPPRYDHFDTSPYVVITFQCRSKFYLFSTTQVLFYQSDFFLSTHFFTFFIFLFYSTSTPYKALKMFCRKKAFKIFIFYRITNKFFSFPRNQLPFLHIKDLLQL